MQRYFLFLALLAIGLLLHVLLCEWGSGSSYWRNSLLTPIVVHTGRGGLIPAGTGLYAGEGIDKADGIVFGLATPLLLLGIDFYLLLGWRQQRRAYLATAPPA